MEFEKNWEPTGGKFHQNILIHNMGGGEISGASSFDKSDANSVVDVNTYTKYPT